MLRNVATDGYVFADPFTPIFSLPGCIIASPSYSATAPGVDQDYIYHWTRDAAIVGLEMAQAPLPFNVPAFIQHYLDEFVIFSKTCQDNTGGNIDHASFNINGTMRQNWGDQSDGPALQSLAVLAAYAQLTDPVKAIAEALVQRNLDFLLTNNKYQSATINLWEETFGLSFFTHAVHLKFFEVVMATLPGLPGIMPPGKTPNDVTNAINWLNNAMQAHWFPNDNFYHSILQASGRGANLNVDVVMAAIYGSVPGGITDNKLLSSAAAVRAFYENGDTFPVNSDVGHGPMIGRYPGDVYVGWNNPWLLCTANFAEFYYRVANEIAADAAKFVIDSLTGAFYQQVGITDQNTPPATVVDALRAAGDRMMSGVLYHSDHFELSEQIDRVSGYERSVLDLTWSYAAFLSAARAR
jgi:glucoamylase